MSKKILETKLKKIANSRAFVSDMPSEEMPDFKIVTPDLDSDDVDDLWAEDTLDATVRLENHEEEEGGQDIFYADPEAQNIFNQQVEWRKRYAEKRTTIIAYDNQYVYTPCYRCLTKFKVDAMDWDYAGPYMYDLAKYAGFEPLPNCDYTIPQVDCISRGQIFKSIKEGNDYNEVDVEFEDRTSRSGTTYLKSFIFGSQSQSGRPVLLEDKSLNFEEKVEEYLSIMEQACREISNQSEPRWSTFWVNYPNIDNIPLPSVAAHIRDMRRCFEKFKLAWKVALPMSFIMGGNTVMEDKNQNIQEDIDQLNEKYSDEELHDLIGKTFNQQKIENIYRRKKYDTPELFAHTKCTECGREKRVMLSNLVKDPTKYGSCVCADSAIDGRVNHATALYNNTKRLRSNTSGYTGVSYVKTYAGQPYDKWRAYIEVDGKRTYLGDFDDKKDAIEARKHAGERGIKWYRQNRNKLIKNMRMRTRKYGTSKYRDTDIKRPEARTEHED